MALLSRSTLQKLAEAKAADARLLFEHQRYSNAYYLYGYAIELGLKACIARLIVAETVPDREILRGFLDHQISRLVGLAGLSEPLKTERKSPEFEIRWNAVVVWSVESRYDEIDLIAAATMKDAVEHPQHGVMTWLRQHW